MDCRRLLFRSGFCGAKNGPYGLVHAGQVFQHWVMFSSRTQEEPSGIATAEPSPGHNDK